MPNARLPKARQRLASGLNYAGTFIWLVALFALYSAPAWIGLTLLGGGLMVLVAGTIVSTNKLRCPGCGRRFWLVGEGGRSNCAFCGAAYFDHPESPE